MVSRPTSHHQASRLGTSRRVEPFVAKYSDTAAFRSDLDTIADESRFTDSIAFKREVDDLRVQALHPEVWEIVLEAREPLVLNTTPRVMSGIGCGHSSAVGARRRFSEGRAAGAATSCSPTSES